MELKIFKNIVKVILGEELNSVVFIKVIKTHDKERLPGINFNDFGFRVNYKEEKILKPNLV